MLVRGRVKPLDSMQTQRLVDKQPWPAWVHRVNDGDTICVERVGAPGICPGIEYIRLAGIDAPELRGHDQAAARFSRDLLAGLILSEVVWIQPTRIWRDPYHRIIARVRLSGLDVGAWLVQRGAAKSRSTTNR